MSIKRRIRNLEQKAGRERERVYLATEEPDGPSEWVTDTHTGQKFKRDEVDLEADHVTLITVEYAEIPPHVSPSRG